MMAQQGTLTRFAWLSITAAIVTMGLKTAAYLLTGSVGLLSDAMESLINLASAGYAAPDNEVLLLDDEGKQVGPEEIGEIAVRSSYLSPEYWQRPDSTEAAFLPDPEGGVRRIHRTGDLGLMMPDGCLIY